MSVFVLGEVGTYPSAVFASLENAFKGAVEWYGRTDLTEVKWTLVYVDADNQVPLRWTTTFEDDSVYIEVLDLEDEPESSKSPAK